MEKTKNLLKEQNEEMLSVNENILDMFSVEELEQRLQMSAASVWNCGTYQNECQPVCTTNSNPPPCSPVAGCSPVVQV